MAPLACSGWSEPFWPRPRDGHFLLRGDKAVGPVLLSCPPRGRSCCSVPLGACLRFSPSAGHSWFRPSAQPLQSPVDQGCVRDGVGEGGCFNETHLFCTVLEARSPGSGCWLGGLWAKTPPSRLVDIHLLAACSHGRHGEPHALLLTLRPALGDSSKITSERPHLQTPSQWASGPQHRDWGGDAAEAFIP